MKSRYSLTLLVLFVLAFVSINFFQLTEAETNQSNQPQPITERPKSVTDSANLTATKTLTKAQKAIPDEIAFEVFLRTVGENNARQLLVKAGLDENKDSDKIEQIMNDAKSVSENLGRLDKQAREIKISKDGGRNFLADAKAKSDLARLQSDKINIIHQATLRNLQDAARLDNGWNKIQNYIQTTVKSRMQIVNTKSSLQSKPQKKAAKDIAFVKTSAEKAVAQTQVGDAYLYSDGWYDGENAYGSGTITENYSSGTSYLVTVTVTSPSGRTNTTSGDWNYATLSNNTGLSLEIESGTYNIQANFEADLGGYYDEWGNYYSYGSYTVGTESNSFVVAPFVTLRDIKIEPRIIFNSGTATVSATVLSSPDVPSNAVLQVRIYETNVTPITYTVTDLEESGSTNSTPRIVNRRISSPGTAFSTNLFTLNVSNTTTQGTIANVVDGVANVTVNGATPVNLQVNPGTTAGGGNCFCSAPGLGCSSCSSYSTYPYNQGCANGFFNFNGCCCIGSPIILDIDGNGYAMTNGANGVSFDINGDSAKDQTSWTAANSDDAWLVLDRNENHTIDNGKEMFGNYCDQPAPLAGTLRNGFTGLAEFDKPANGGNGDGKITRADTVFKRLRLWQDKNHNGNSEAEELSKLPALDVVAIYLDYKESKRTDEFGNRFKFRAKVRDRTDSRVGRWAWDVFVNPPTH